MVLVVALTLQLVWPSQSLRPGASPRVARRIGLAAIRPIADYPAILNRPVFAPDRRPGASGGALPGGGALSAYAALGAAAGPSVATAVLSGPGGVMKTLERGDTLEGWTLVAVGPTRLTFERDGARHVLVIGAPSEEITQAEKDIGPPEPAPSEPREGHQ